MKYSRTTGIITLIIFIVLVVWISIFVMADKWTTGSPLPITPALTPPESVATGTSPAPIVSDGSASSTPPSVMNSGVARIDGPITIGGVTILPKKIVEDSRCPLGVMCIQAGRIRVLAEVSGAGASTTQVFLLGEPFMFADSLITMTLAEPLKRKETSILPTDYELTFRVEKQQVIYAHATPNLIRVEVPLPGAVVGRQFLVKGLARGSWFFEASFPVVIYDGKGKLLMQTIAHADSDWMTEEFVPFTANVSVPKAYSGDAFIVLKKDNPSGMAEKDASISFPIHITY